MFGIFIWLVFFPVFSDAVLRRNGAVGSRATDRFRDIRFVRCGRV